MKTCKTCKKELVKTYYYRIPKVFCSNKCKVLDQTSGITMVEKICEFCGKDFMVQKNWGKGKFCSQDCSKKYHIGVNASAYKGGFPNCEVCGKQLSALKFKRCLKHAVEISKYKISGSNHYNWHSQKIDLSGENNPMYIDGRTPINERIRHSIEYEEWRTKVFERDLYTCQDCGQIGGYLQADHIKPFAYFIELRFELSNGRTLCIPCHQKTDTFGVKARRLYGEKRLRH